MNEKLHRDEIPIGEELVQQLIGLQFPEYRHFSIMRLSASGSSNVQFSLGDHLLIRMPRLPGGGEVIEKEGRWLPEVSKFLPVDVPEVVSIGEPALGYSEHWSIVRWQVGEHPEVCTPSNEPMPERLQLAREIAKIIRAFRNIEVSKKALDDPQLLLPYRGRPLAEHDRQFLKNVEDCRKIEGLNLDFDKAIAIWEQARELPDAHEAPKSLCWFHGDLTAENLLTRNGHLTGLLDFGGIGLGDPVVDLIGAWEILDAPAREEFRDRSAIGESEWLRGRAWALAVALMIFPYYWNTMPNRINDRLAIVQSVLADPL